MMLNDGRICFIVVPDENIMVCCSKYSFSDFMTVILNCMSYKEVSMLMSERDMFVVDGQWITYFNLGVYF